MSITPTVPQPLRARSLPANLSASVAPPRDLISLSVSGLALSGDIPRDTLFPRPTLYYRLSRCKGVIVVLRVEISMLLFDVIFAKQF